jgi:signal recognition particle subunit SRP54
MFDSLSERLNAVLDGLTRRGALSEADVDAALREVRRALLSRAASPSKSGSARSASK